MGIFNSVKDEAAEVELDYEATEAVEEIEEKVGDFTVGDKPYDIQFNSKQLRLYENSHPPIMATFTMYHGMLSLGDLIAITAYGLREHGKNFVPPKQAMKMAAELVEENGYAPVMEIVINALERDCGFLFAGAED
ncbi:MAG: hypothetical protein RSG23_05190 [Gordonibacter sp.]|uniref:hypothetical protein n=1 Tax=Gordonibacter sp. TaxID=1968902 RepID=UPI002FCB4105